MQRSLGKERSSSPTHGREVRIYWPEPREWGQRSLHAQGPTLLRGGDGCFPLSSKLRPPPPLPPPLYWKPLEIFPALHSNGFWISLLPVDFPPSGSHETCDSLNDPSWLQPACLRPELQPLLPPHPPCPLHSQPSFSLPSPLATAAAFLTLPVADLLQALAHGLCQRGGRGDRLRGLRQQPACPSQSRKWGSVSHCRLPTPRGWAWNSQWGSNCCLLSCVQGEGSQPPEGLAATASTFSARGCGEDSDGRVVPLQPLVLKASQLLLVPDRSCGFENCRLRIFP